MSNILCYFEGKKGEWIVERILKPEHVNFTTRFKFDKSINISTIRRLVLEFFPKDQNTILDNPSLQSFKYINPIKKQSIEITSQYISFFPEITEHLQIEDYRERIYRIIARKNEVYYQTALDNMQLALSSIISGNLRSCANLLYYSLHKFYSSLMYQYINTEVNIPDEEIGIKELRHFGSRIFVQSLNKYQEIEKSLTSDNYLRVLTKNVNPFILSRIIFNNKRIDVIEENLVEYLKFYLQKKWSISIDDPDIEFQLNNKISHYSTPTGKNEIDEVDLAILIASQKFFEFEEGYDGILYLLDLLAVRLYWLRQTADYDYDFEVKTSTRELAIISACIESLFNLFKKNDSNSFDQFLDSLEPEDIESQKIKLPYKEIQRYAVNVSFPDNIKFDTKNRVIFLTAVHLEPFFKLEEIFFTMNLMTNIENHGKYFKFTDSSYVNTDYYLHLNNDGRWFIWLENPAAKFEADSYLFEAFNNFIVELHQKYNEIFFDNLDINIVCSSVETDYSKSEDNKILNLYFLNSSVKKEIYNIESSISKLLAQNLNSDSNNKIIIIEDLKIFCNLILDDELVSLSSISNILEDKLDPFSVSEAENIEYLFLNIYVNDIYKTDNPRKMNNFITLINEYISEHISEKLNIGKDIFQSVSYVSSTKEIENMILNNQLNNDLEQSLYKLLNNIIYNKLKVNSVTTSQKNILEKIISKTKIDNYYYATLGMWYLRNTTLTPFERFSYGSFYYTKAKEHAIKFHETLEFNYNFELANCCYECGFYIAAKNFYEIVMNYIDEAETDVISEINHKLEEINTRLKALVYKSTKDETFA